MNDACSSPYATKRQPKMLVMGQVEWRPMVEGSTLSLIIESLLKQPTNSLFSFQFSLSCRWEPIRETS